jgi:hypothetical protein
MSMVRTSPARGTWNDLLEICGSPSETPIPVDEWLSLGTANLSSYGVSVAFKGWFRLRSDVGMEFFR